MAETYLFTLGRTPELGFLELRRFFPEAQLIHSEVVRVKSSDQIKADAFIAKLGGTIKIASVLGTLSALSAESLVGFLSNNSREIHFGISMYGEVLPSTFLRQMKEILEQKGIRARYATARHGETLSSVTVDKQHVHELIVVKTELEYVVGKTAAVQPYEEWGKRDYGRPHADAKSGMLPPKIARMLVNIAGSYLQAPSSKLPAVLLDPFCGMGTVLAEGFLCGWGVIGSDASAGAIEKTKKNLNWLGASAQLFVKDATHVSEVLPGYSVDAIVTEPFMGDTNFVNKPHADASEVKNIIKGLEKLYIGCLRDWVKVLVPKGVVIIALPEYAVSGRTYFVKKVVDNCENLGYTVENGPVEYSRPQATVRRKFYIFRKLA